MSARTLRSVEPYEDYGSLLRRVNEEREVRVARRLYETWNELLAQPTWENAQDGTRWKWRRMARVAIAEVNK